MWCDSVVSPCVRRLQGFKVSRAQCIRFLGESSCFAIVARCLDFTKKLAPQGLMRSLLLADPVPFMCGFSFNCWCSSFGVGAWQIPIQFATLVNRIRAWFPSWFSTSGVDAFEEAIDVICLQAIWHVDLQRRQDIYKLRGEQVPKSERFLRFLDWFWLFLVVPACLQTVAVVVEASLRSFLR